MPPWYRLSGPVVPGAVGAGEGGGGEGPGGAEGEGAGGEGGAAEAAGGPGEGGGGEAGGERPEPEAQVARRDGRPARGLPAQQAGVLVVGEPRQAQVVGGRIAQGVGGHEGAGDEVGAVPAGHRVSPGSRR